MHTPTESLSARNGAFAVSSVGTCCRVVGPLVKSTWIRGAAREQPRETQMTQAISFGHIGALRVRPTPRLSCKAPGARMRTRRYLARYCGAARALCQLQALV